MSPASCTALLATEPTKKKEKVNRYLLDFTNETGNEIDWRAYLNNEVRDLVDITVA